MTSYKLLTYEHAEKGPRAGILVHETIHDVAELTGAPTDANVLSLLESWDSAEQRLRDSAARVNANGLVPDAVRLRAPVIYPPAIYCAGANYKDHAAEMARHQNRQPPPDPHTLGLNCFFFMKSGRTVADPVATLDVSTLSDKLDWEIELAAVIGRVAKRVTEKDALNYVAGYTIANDLSARDFGFRAVDQGSPFRTDWLSSKNFDNSCPLGPWITPARDIADPHNLRMTLNVNGAVKQDSNSGRMIYNINEQIAYLSSRITLYPGDVVLTGTPAGVGVARNEFLHPGDRVELSIENIGTLTHSIA